MTKLASLLTLTLFHVAACGGNDAAPIAIAELPHEFAHVFCERTFDCCSEAELADEFAGLDPKPTTVEECVEVVEGIIEFEDEQAGIDAGRVIYDAAIAGTCLEEFRGIACTGDLDDSDCTPFVGQVALGDECAS